MAAMLDLPTEILFQIVKEVQLADELDVSRIGYPPQGLFSLSTSCRRLHEICTSLLRRVDIGCGYSDDFCLNEDLALCSDYPAFFDSVAYMDLDFDSGYWGFTRCRTDSDLDDDEREEMECK